MNTQALLAELEHELISTAKLLDLVPASQLHWKPNPKAMSLGQLAYHVAVIPARYLQFAKDGDTDLDELTNHYVPKDKQEIISSFEKGSNNAKAILAQAHPEWATQSWNLTKKGAVVFTLPISLFVRLLVLNHLYHHRGQLSAYLRSLDVRLPSIYGPSADENPFD